MEKEELKGVSLINSITIFTIVTALVLIFLIFTSFRVNSYFKRVKSDMETFISSSNNSQLIKDTTDELSNLVRLFVITENPLYAELYIQEKFSHRTTEKTFDSLKKVSEKNSEIYANLEEELQKAEKLYNLELYAIKLVYEANKSSISDIPVQIKNTRLNSADEKLNRQQLLEKARESVFGEEYILYKNQIKNTCNATTNQLEQKLNQELNTNSIKLGSSIFWLNLLLSLLCIAIIVLFIFQKSFVFVPLKHFINAVKYDLPLEEVGTLEFKILAETYNDSYELKKRTEKNLLLTAEHDALTGILNRRAFDEVCLKTEGNMAILLVDLDDFKHVNDTWGHEAGDVALKALARALTSAFRKDDYICRIGGDEFSVILKDFNPDAEVVIYTKIQQVADMIKHVNENFGITISVGAALSSSGFSQELFNQADKALYEVKNNGKNGCEIFNSSVGLFALDNSTLEEI